MSLLRSLFNLFKRLDQASRMKDLQNLQDELLKKAMAFYNVGDYVKSIEIFLLLTRLKPDYADGQAFLGATYGLLGKFKDAIRVSKQAISIDPCCSKAYGNIASASLALGNLGEALEAGMNAVKINQYDAGSYAVIAESFLQLGQPKEAAEAAEKAIKIKPDYEEAYLTLGTAYLDLNFDQEAINAFKQAILINPNNPLAQLSLEMAMSKIK